MDPSTYKIISLIIQGLVAFGTIATAFIAIIIAIWGELIRNWFGPNLEIKFENHKGYLHGKTIYYQLKIINKRKWAPARNVRILCTAISKKRPDGSFTQEPMLYPIPLTWAPSEFTSLESTFASEDLCDLGNVTEGKSFCLAARYYWTNKFPGIMNANDAMRIRLSISSYNFISKIPFDIEISWDGVWSDNLEEMAKHLVIKEVKKQNHA